MKRDEELHPKDRLPPEEGIVHPAGEIDRVHDASPTETDSVETDTWGRRLDKRPTDGPL